MADNALQRLRDKAGLKRKEPSKPPTEAELGAMVAERHRLVGELQRGHSFPVHRPSDPRTVQETINPWRSKLERIREGEQLYNYDMRDESEARDASAIRNHPDKRTQEEWPDDVLKLAEQVRLKSKRISDATERAPEKFGGKAYEFGGEFDHLLMKWKREVDYYRMTDKDRREALRDRRQRFRQNEIENPSWLRRIGLLDRFESVPLDVSGDKSVQEGRANMSEYTFKEYLQGVEAEADQSLKEMGLSTNVTYQDAASQRWDEDNTLTYGLEGWEEKARLERLMDKPADVDPSTGLPYAAVPTPSRLEAILKQPAIIIDPQTGLPVGGGVVGEVRNLMEMRRELDRRKALPSP